MSWKEYIQVAWHAHQGGNYALRDAMLTLAVGLAESDQPWIISCRDRLVTARPQHFLASYTTVGEALTDPRVSHYLKKLEAQYPLSRIRFFLLKHEALTGPYVPAVRNLDDMLKELTAPIHHSPIRKHLPEPLRGPSGRSRAFAHAEVRAESSIVGDGNGPIAPRHRRPSYSSNAVTEDEPVSTEALYLSVLVSIALLLAMLPNEY